MVEVNTLKPRQNGRHCIDDIFKWIFLNENVRFPTKISLKFVPKGLINNIPLLAQIMAWCRPGDKPLSEPMMVILSTHICVTRPQWVNAWTNNYIPQKNMVGYLSISLSQLTHWGRDKMNTIFQMTFSNGFSWMKMYEFQLTFHWSLFLGVQLTIFQHWFR